MQWVGPKRMPDLPVLGTAAVVNIFGLYEYWPTPLASIWQHSII